MNPVLEDIIDWLRELEGDGDPIWLQGLCENFALKMHELNVNEECILMYYEQLIKRIMAVFGDEYCFYSGSTKYPICDEAVSWVPSIMLYKRNKGTLEMWYNTTYSDHRRDFCGFIADIIEEFCDV